MKDERRFRDHIERLTRTKPDVFGASGHDFEWNPPLPESAVAEFERMHGARLPDGYRWYITTIADGGAGPGYGLFPLGETDEGPASEFFADLGKPFPYLGPWNDISVSEDEYFANVDGALPICHMGCAIRIFVVVTGREAGNVWMDDRASDGGWSPLRQTFLQWYEEWMETSLRRED